MEYLVYKAVGDRTYVMVGSFDNPDFASEFVEDEAREDAKKEFPEGTDFDEIDEEWWEAVDKALTYYSIDEVEA